jgi:hypothetical protein
MPLRPPATQALGARVIPDSADSPDVRGDRLPQRPMALKRQVRIGVVVIDRPPRCLDRDGWRPDIGVEVLQTQDRRVARRVGLVAGTVDTDPRDMP